MIDAYEDRERQLDHRTAVLAQLLAGLAGLKHYKAERSFPRLAEGDEDYATGGGRTRYEIEEIPPEWKRITGDEAKKWIAILNLK